MKMIEILVDDEPQAKFDTLVQRRQIAERDAQVRFNALSDEEREGRSLLTPTESTVGMLWSESLTRGVSELAAEGRYPNVAIGLGAPRSFEQRVREYKKGEVAFFQVELPIGTEIISMHADPDDGPNWDVVNLCFGAMNLISPHGDCVPLSQILNITCKDLLSPFEHKRTKTDVRVYVQLVCRKDSARFSGFCIRAHLLDQTCGLGCRIESADDVREFAFPAERVRFDYTIAVPPSTTGTEELLRALNDSLKGLEGVWPDSKFSLIAITPKAQLIELRAFLQARTEDDLDVVVQRLLLEAKSVEEAENVKFVFHPGRFNPWQWRVEVEVWR
jgi:hypothetical protein